MLLLIENVFKCVPCKIRAYTKFKSFIFEIIFINKFLHFRNSYEIPITVKCESSQLAKSRKLHFPLLLMAIYSKPSFQNERIRDALICSSRQILFLAALLALLMNIRAITFSSVAILPNKVLCDALHVSWNTEKS